MWLENRWNGHPSVGVTVFSADGCREHLIGEPKSKQTQILETML